MKEKDSVKKITPFLWFDKSQRVMKAMLQIDKLDIQKLKEAYDGKGK
jgi:hypothetical protein